MGYVFIAYARSDRVLVDRIRKELAKARKKRGVDLEPQTTDVLVVKFLLLATSAAALLQSFRFVSGTRDA